MYILLYILSLQALLEALPTRSQLVPLCLCLTSGGEHEAGERQHMPGSINTSPWQRGESLAIEKIKAIQRRLENLKRNQPYIVMQHDTHNWNDANTLLSTGMVQTDVLMMKR